MQLYCCIPGQNQMVEIQRFTEPDKRVLVINNETFGKSDLTDIPFILHFEVPVEKETYIERIIADEQDDNKERLSITFTTDLELSAVKKIEQATGHKIQVGELPVELVIQKEQQVKKAEKTATKAENKRNCGRRSLS